MSGRESFADEQQMAFLCGAVLGEAFDAGLDFGFGEFFIDASAPRFIEKVGAAAAVVFAAPLKDLADTLESPSRDDVACGERARWIQCAHDLDRRRECPTSVEKLAFERTLLEEEEARFGQADREWQGREATTGAQVGDCASAWEKGQSQETVDEVVVDQGRWLQFATDEIEFLVLGPEQVQVLGQSVELLGRDAQLAQDWSLSEE